MQAAQDGRVEVGAPRRRRSSSSEKGKLATIGLGQAGVFRS